MSHRTLFMVVSASMLLAILACNAPAVRQTEIATPDELPTQISQNAVTATLVNPTAACPQAGEGTSAYLNREAGFCFLYPAELSLPPGDGRASDSVGLYGPPFPPDSMEPASVSLTVTYTGPAVYVSDSAEYADRWLDILMGEYPDKPQPEPTLVNGREAVMMRNLPGWSPIRTVFVVANGHQYTISVSPELGLITDLDPLARQTWDTVTDSIVFFEPTLVKEIVKSEDVCPQATAETQMRINLAHGFCFLAPVDATPDPLFLTSGFEIGPTGTHPEFSEVRVSLVIGTYGPASGATNPRDAAQGPLSSGVDLDTIQDITIDGRSAITYIDTDGPWWHRLAVVIANDTVYTINMNPYDQQQYPSMIPDADRLWETVISSLAFFTPFE
ncbi:MAG: hypothetical protein JXB07_01200 [Anaerolineae bacterium]|nr:hypothetical protein [Anaerolineae bacterium]